MQEVEEVEEDVLWRRMCSGGGLGGGVEQEVEEVEVGEIRYIT
jgi:hypothetical protein